MSEPLELVIGPFEVYTAPVGQAYPAIDVAPAGNWALLGTSGSDNVTEEGITITHTQTVETDAFRMFGSAGPRKAARTAEDLTVTFTLADLTAAQYAKALNGNTVTPTLPDADSQGFNTMGLSRGLEVVEYALLIRGVGKSPSLAGANIQYEVPRCFQNGSPAPVFVKGAPAGLMFEFKAIEDPDAGSDAQRFGRLVIATTAATG